MDYDFTYTGAEIQAILDTAKKLKDSGYIFLGVATPSTNPGTPTQKVYYEAKQAGTYTNFGGVVLPDGISLLIWNGSWTSETVMCGDGGVFDISVYKSSGGTLATFADLAAALNGGNNIPVGARKGGMSVKFVQSYDNKYIQARCMAQNFTTDVTQWQGVDDEPTAGSDNLVKSGGVGLIIGDVFNADNISPTTSYVYHFEVGHTYVLKNGPVACTYVTRATANGSNLQMFNGTAMAANTVASLTITDKAEYLRVGGTAGGANVSFILYDLGSIKGEIEELKTKAFDISEYNATENPYTLATYADLTAALNALPTNYRKGGMSIKFVQNSDNNNKYVQYRLMATSFSADEDDWQGVDDEPTVNSENLVKSGGVANSLFKITGNKSYTQTIRKLNSGWTYHISAFSGLQGHKAKVTLKDPNGALTMATFYYGASTTGSYFTLNSEESKVITFPTDFTELSMYVGDAWVTIQNPTDVEIVFEYAEGSDYRLEECEKIKSQVDENTLNLTNELEIKDKVLGDSNQGYIESSGVITFYATWYYSTMLLKAGETIEVTTDYDVLNYPKIGIANSGNVAVGDTVEIVSGNKYTASEDTWIVISCGSNPSSIKLSGTLKIIADEKPTIGNDNFVRSSGVAESEKEIKIAGRIPQSTDVLVKYNTAFANSYICNVGAKAGDTIIATLTDSKSIFESTTELILYHGNAQGGVPYTAMSVNSPTEIKINNDVEHFTLYVPKNVALRSGYISLSIDYIKKDDIIDVTLPSKAYAYVGGEFNIYNENVAFITQKDRYYLFWSIENMNSNDYIVYSDRLRILPTSDMIGTYEVTLQVSDRFDNSVIYSKSFTLEIVANTPVTNKKVLFIGDSLTGAGYYPHFVEYLSNNGIQSIGTIETEVWSSFVDGRKDIVHHEGRGGWSAMDYVRNYAEYRTDVPNPFWNETTGKFDFGYYISSQGYSRPDAVFINLGTNNVYFLAGTINAIKEMITSIHAYDSTIPILVSLITPPSVQRGYANIFEYYARNQRKEYIKEFEDKLANVDVSPVYFNIDRYYDFPTAEEPVSQRNTTIIVRQTDIVHPSRFGYYKMGDVYYADLMNILS